MIDLLETRRGRRVLFALLYLTEGAPIGYLWWALPTRMRAAGLSASEIGAFVGLLAIPWACKFLWAPAIDAMRGPRWGLRAWIASAQLVMALALVPHAFIDPATGYTLLLATSLVHGFAAATQDVAIDALAISATPAAERGSLNGAMQVGMLSGRAVFGAGGLVLGSGLGAGAPPLLIVGLLLFSLLVLRYGVASQAVAAVAVGARIRELVTFVLRDRRTWRGLGFAALAGAGFEAVGALAGPLLVDRGATTAEVGWFFAAVSTPALALGAVLGGVIADRSGARRTSSFAVVATAVAVFTLAAVDELRPDADGARIVALGAVYLTCGALIGASYALFMHLAEGPAAATAFSAWMAGTNLCEAWSAAAAGRLTDAIGYGGAFAILAFVSLGSLLLVAGLDPHRRPLTSSA